MLTTALPQSFFGDSVDFVVVDVWLLSHLLLCYTHQLRKGTFSDIPSLFSSANLKLPKLPILCYLSEQVDIALSFATMDMGEKKKNIFPCA